MANASDPEGAGIVERVGGDVRAVAPGDAIILTFLPCGS
jgi:Zn-dependent alcohol dehydrogenase